MADGAKMNLSLERSSRSSPQIINLVMVLIYLESVCKCNPPPFLLYVGFFFLAAKLSIFWMLVHWLHKQKRKMQWKSYSMFVEFKTIVLPLWKCCPVKTANSQISKILLWRIMLGEVIEKCWIYVDSYLFNSYPFLITLTVICSVSL